VVNIESVWFGSPLARTTRTASATISPTPSPTPSGVTEKAMSMLQGLAVRAVNPEDNGSQQRLRKTTTLTFRS